MDCILRKASDQWMGPAMEQCNEADMTIEALHINVTSAMKQQPSCRGFTY